MSITEFCTILFSTALYSNIATDCKHVHRLNGFLNPCTKSIGWADASNYRMKQLITDYISVLTQVLEGVLPRRFQRPRSSQALTLLPFYNCWNKAALFCQHFIQIVLMMQSSPSILKWTGGLQCHKHSKEWMSTSVLIIKIKTCVGCGSQQICSSDCVSKCTEDLETL